MGSDATGPVTGGDAARRAARLRRLHTRQVPALRSVGLGLLVASVVVHNGLIFGAVDWAAWGVYALGVGVYVAATWLVVARWYRPDARLDLPLLILALDTVPLAVTVYMTGADRSWIFWVFLFRVADQASTTLRRALGFSALGVAAYLAVLGYAGWVDGRALAWPAELAKLSFLAAGGLYIAATARTAERVRARLADAVRTAQRSVTKLNEKSGQLEQARAQAEAASRAKSEFLSRVSHELRTPMNAILGFAQLLEMDRLTDDQRASVKEILESGRHLLDIINEVLDIARVETGSLARELAPVHVGAALEEVLERAAAAASRREIRLPERVPRDADVWVRGSDRKLRQVFANLMSNAIKYNRTHGRVELACRVNADTVRISVTDTGPGIAAERVEAAFSPFERLGVDASVTPGTGLGLSVARSLAEAMGGRIGVDTREGAGSTFWVELERVAAPEPAEGPAVQEDTDRPGPLVLYIDDKPENLTLVRRILARRPGIRLASAALGLNGLELARARHPDLVLLDLDLPDVAGREVLARLREDPATRDIPVVVVSAEAAPAKVERVLAEGARAYITMPYDVARFLETVDEALERSTT